MNAQNTAVIILAAGLGTRMKSDRPKAMHELAGRPVIGHVIAAAATLKPSKIVLVIGPGMDQVLEAARKAAPGIEIAAAIQQERKGTGHATQQAEPALRGFTGDIVVAAGDMPLMAPSMLEELVKARRAASDPAVVVAGMRPEDPGAYGRLVTAADGTLERIVEARDATPAILKIGLCNSSIMAFDGAILFRLLSQLTPDNDQREYYLTDTIELAHRANRRCAVIEGRAEDLVGINSRAELAAAEAIIQTRLRNAAMAGGATLTDPNSVWFSHDTRIGRDVVVGPSVVFATGVSVGDGVEIKAFCHLEGAKVAAGATIGPFARLRPGAEIGEGAHIGNFVEIKNARVEAGAKVNHLSYVGDARVGAKANVGAGTITCNYDGYVKSFTDIGEGVFVGSSSVLVAPIKIGKGAYVAAGSTITEDVPDDALAFGRARQAVKRGRAAELRKRLAAQKAAASAPKTKAKIKAKAAPAKSKPAKSKRKV
jgi:bifunctional UDP-N-acetylglucosamine pyrophosphorylase / glucosamine-1-phosphate N-acetyltransferase